MAPKTAGNKTGVAKARTSSVPKPRASARAVAKPTAKNVLTTESSKPTAAPTPEPPCSTLSVAEAEKLFRGLQPEDLAKLAESADPLEQVVARAALEIVGDRDVSWGNAQVSLRTGADFVKEILEMEGGAFITKMGLERLEKIGTVDPAALAGRSRAAYVFALYIDACVRGAKERLGMKVPTQAEAPAPDEKPPEWPMKIHFADIHGSVAEAAKWGRTALLVCCGHAREVDTFFNYRAVSTIDAKWLMSEVVVKKTLSLEEAREELRRRVVSAMKFGQPLHIAMSNSAVAIKSTYCCEGLFPETVFKNELFSVEEEYNKIIRESDLVDWPGAFPGRKRPECFSFVTTDFDLASAREHLPEALPHFDDMAIYEIDSASFTD